MKSLIYLLSFLILLASCKNEPEGTNALTLGKLTLEDATPSPGDSLNISYNEKAVDSIEAMFYYLVNTNAYAVDIHLKNDTKNALKATIQIPDSASAIAFNIKKNEEIDNNNKEGYIIPLYNSEGQIIAGSNAAKAYYRLNFGERNELEVNKDSIVTAIQKDITEHPEISKEWKLVYLDLMYKERKEEGKKLVTKYIDSLSSKESLTEKEYQSLLRMYNLTGNKEKADSIKTAAIATFPKSKIAERESLIKVYEIKDLDEKTKAYADFKTKFPEATGQINDAVLRTIALAYNKEGDVAKFDEYANQIDEELNKASVYNSVAWEKAEAKKDLDFAENLSKQSLELINSLKEDPSNKPDYFSESQFKNRLEGTYQMYADTYGLILFQQGKTKEAIDTQKIAVGDGKSVDVNKRYLEFLMTDKQYKTVLEKGESFIKSGNSNPEMLDYYVTAYKEVNGEEGLEAKVAELEAAAHNLLVEKIKSNLISEAAAEFALKDMEGKEVSLSSLKGKVVILDFWATWCGPCKASFPEMQQLVEKYKDNENVAILFVNTFENTPKREKDITDFITKNKYDFHVILDAPIKDSRNFEVADSYGIRGIPTKIIISPEGKINYKSVGYEGNGKLLTEMEILIELIEKS
ncbi:TlpA disulfide reductase family protein [Galbibacter orientalis]|uniref:TlpA family protein disulfide reductase n=1 Tax=Galbibacter orientalis TaxID=453852 RepID=UPI00308067D0